jgi:3-methyl-2-oxobutanoate hydroxymethyltransferase
MPDPQPTPRKKITLPYLFKKVSEGSPITWLTCYDYPTAYLQEQAGIEMILVGDSLGMTMLGYDSTLPVTMDDMVRHAQAVRRGAPTAFVVGDMPYMTYQPSVETAIRNAGRFMSECGCRLGDPGHRSLGLDPAIRQRVGRFPRPGEVCISG